MRLIIQLCCLLAFALSGFAQVLTVKDKVTYQPLQYVRVSTQVGEFTAVTDAEGRAEVSALSDGDSIHVAPLGYEPMVLSYQQLAAMNFKLLLEQTPIWLDEVVVAAGRWQQNKRDVANKVTLVKAADVILDNPQTAADLLGSSNEVFIQKSQLGGGSPMIRGFAANRVLLVVDGVRMNNAIFRSGNLQNVISIDPFAINNTEVVFGPGSMLYGSDAIGGVMNFNTLMPSFAYGGSPLVSGSAVARGSSADGEKTGHLDLKLGLQKWAFVSSASFTDFGNLQMGSNGPDEYLRPEFQGVVNGEDVAIPNDDPEEQATSGYDQLNVMQKIRFNPNPQWDVNFGFHYTSSSDVPRYDRLIEYRNGHLRSAEWYYGPQKWLMNALNIEHNAGHGAFDRARLTLAHQHFEESRHDRGFGGKILDHRTEEVDALSANLDFEKTLSASNTVFYGAEVVLNKVGSEGEGENIETGAREAISTRYPDGATWNSYAAYISNRWCASDDITVQAGLRYNQVTLDAVFDTSFFPFPFTKANINTGALTASAGMVYHPGTSWEFSLNLSTGFRAPNVDDIGKVFDSEPGSVVIPNPNLAPEYAYNAEVGFARTFSDVLKLDLSGYYTFLDKAMVRRDFTLNGQDSIFYDGSLSQVQAIQNAADANVRGIQAGIEIKLPSGFQLLSRFNYQKGEEELDDGATAPLRHAGPWFGATHLIYAQNRLKLDFCGNYNGKMSYDDLATEEQGKPHIYAQDENGNPYSPAWHTFNLKAMYHLTNLLMVTAGVENITDQRYRPYSSGIVASGRNFIASLRVGF